MIDSNLDFNLDFVCDLFEKNDEKANQREKEEEEIEIEIDQVAKCTFLYQGKNKFNQQKVKIELEHGATLSGVSSSSFFFFCIEGEKKYFAKSKLSKSKV